MGAPVEELQLEEEEKKKKMKQLAAKQLNKLIGEHTPSLAAFVAAHAKDPTDILRVCRILRAIIKEIELHIEEDFSQDSKDWINGMTVEQRMAAIQTGAEMVYERDINMIEEAQSN
jgi:hypothetical protein